MYKRLQEICKSKGTTVTALCKDVTGNSGNLATWKKGYMRSDYLAKSADILQCSTDYILGRDNYTNNGNLINTGDIHGDHNATITTSEQNSEMEKEISSILSGLNFREKTELMTVIYKFVDEHKK